MSRVEQHWRGQGNWKTCPTQWINDTHYCPNDTAASCRFEQWITAATCPECWSPLSVNNFRPVDVPSSAATTTSGPIATTASEAISKFIHADAQVTHQHHGTAAYSDNNFPRTFHWRQLWSGTRTAATSCYFLRTQTYQQYGESYFKIYVKKSSDFQ